MNFGLQAKSQFQFVFFSGSLSLTLPHQDPNRGLAQINPKRNNKSAVRFRCEVPTKIHFYRVILHPTAGRMWFLKNQKCVGVTDGISK